MSRVGCNLLVAMLVCASALVCRANESPTSPVKAVVETSLTTAAPHIRQFAFDGNADTYFASKENPKASEHFTLAFDRPVELKSVAVKTGKPEGGDRLEAGLLEVSEDGERFEELGKFVDGSASAKSAGRRVKAIRVKPSADMDHPLAIREFTIESEPPVMTFKYPVEVIVNVDDAPEMKDWAEKTARICEREYPMICEELRSDGFKPRSLITMTLKSDYRGVAATGGGRITGSVKYFKAHQDDVGAMVHETVHVVQQYRTRNNPGWLVEGIADYIRFYKYEPKKARPPSRERARYNGSYRITAAFLDFVSEKYDKDLVRKLNKAMREGEYKEELWQSITKKTLPELEAEWKQSLRG
jgi:hypothetical protein